MTLNRVPDLGAEALRIHNAKAAGKLRGFPHQIGLKGGQCEHCRDAGFDQFCGQGQALGCVVAEAHVDCLIGRFSLEYHERGPAPDEPLRP